MARFTGRKTGLWAGGLLGLVTIGPLAVFSPLAAISLLAGLGLIGTGITHGRQAVLRSRCDKLSQEIDVLSKRLLKAEQGEPRRAAAAAPDGTLRDEVHELTVEIGLLSGIVRDLSAVIRSQDAEIAALKARPVEVAPRAIEARIEPLPVPVPAPIPTAPPLPPAPQPLPPTPQPRTAAVPVLPGKPEGFVPPPVASQPEPVQPRRPIPPRPVPSVARPDENTVVAAFDADQLDVFLQPVVTLPQRKVVAYEALACLRVEGQLLEAARYLPALERHGRTTELDRRMLARAGTIVGHLSRRGSDARVTYALSPLSLFEPGFLKDTARMAGEDPALASLDIALPQGSWRGLDSGQLALLTALRGRIGFCVDRPTDLRFDARELAGYGIGQVRVPAELLLRPAPSQGAMSDIAIEDLAPALARARIRLVVVGVAGEADVPDLIDLNVPFAQGTAFAPARPVRGEILAATAPEPPLPPEDDPGTERRSFRSLLRRAS